MTLTGKVEKIISLIYYTSKKLSGIDFKKFLMALKVAGDNRGNGRLLPLDGRFPLLVLSPTAIMVSQNSISKQLLSYGDEHRPFFKSVIRC